MRSSRSELMLSISAHRAVRCMLSLGGVQAALLREPRGIPEFTDEGSVEFIRKVVEFDRREA
jgi:hypothetical protein